MDFIDELHILASRIPKQLEHLQTEEGAKHALVMPFIRALGYDIFDPTEVTPEFVADVGIKKGEKVDYVILQGNKPIILFECKGFNADLDRLQPTQLYRYFSVCEARFAVLTNGTAYRFFTDLEQPNKLDLKPFFEFNMLNITDAAADELKRFTKSSFNLEQNINAAVELKYTKEIKRILAEQMSSPSEEFVRFFASQLYGSRLTTAIRQQFADITKRGLHQFISERISDRLKSALADESGSSTLSSIQSQVGAASTPVAADQEQLIQTTTEELEAFYIVKSILREVVDVKRVHSRDTRSYFGVLLDDNNRKPICRLRFNFSQKYLGLFNQSKEEERVGLTDLNDIYQHADRLKATIGFYETVKVP
jgi:hypothetical protein